MPRTPWVRPIRDPERPLLADRVVAGWGSPAVASRGRLHTVADLDCLVALRGNEWLGVAAFRVDGSECEIVLLEAFERYQGAGSALVSALADRSHAAGVERLWLVTTNDNVDALRFYQRRGFSIAALHRDAATEARRTLKPEIPLVGAHGIPIRDEIELERWLVEPPAP